MKMIRIEKTEQAIKVTGHAVKEVCAMMTALCVAFVHNIQAETSTDLDYAIKDGYFYLPLAQFKDKDAFTLMLVRCLQRNLSDLADDYPSSVQLIRY
jgi:uncharacterized protein YsxB (DUF464 family)